MIDLKSQVGRLKTIASDYWPYLIIILVNLLFFGKNLWFKEIFVTPTFGLGDISQGSIPLKFYLAQTLKQGRLPLWTDGIYSGMPLLAESLIGALSPVSLIYVIFNPFFAQIVTFFIEFGISMVFMYKYTRLINFSKPAALVSAVIFTFSGFFTLRLMHQNVLDAALLLPAVFYFTEKLVRGRQTSAIFGLTLVFTVQFLSGGAQFAVYSIIACWLYVIFGVLVRSKNVPLTGRSFFGLALAQVFALGLSAIQIIPTLEYIGYSVRAGGVRADALNEFPFYFKELMALVLPKIWGTPLNFSYQPPFALPGVYWENTPFIGWTAASLAVIGLLISKKNRQQIFFIFLFILAVLLSVGSRGPLWFVFKLPPLSYFRAAARFMLWGVFAAGILAAGGVDLIYQRLKKSRLLIILLLISLIVYELLRFGREFNATYKYNDWFAEPETAQIIKARDPNARIYNVMATKNPQDFAYFKMTQKYRGWSSGLDKYARLTNFLPPSLNLIYGINNARGLIALEPKRPTELENWRQAFLQKDFSKAGDLVLSDKSLTTINLSSVNYLLSYVRLTHPQLNLLQTVPVDEEINIYLYQNLEALPNAYISFNTILAKSDAQILEIMGGADFDLRKQVVVEEESGLLDTSDPIEFQPVDQLVKENDGSQVIVSTNIAKPGFLVLTDTYYPGWTASVCPANQSSDGSCQKAKIYRANYNFRAVKLEPGEYKITFKYEPQSFRWGMGISLATGISVLLWSGLAWVHKFLKKKRLT